MFIDSKIADIFYFTDEFCKEFNKTLEGAQLKADNSKKSRNKPCKLSDSEVITILIAFHLGGYRNLKHFYTQYVQVHLTSEFPETVSYNRFVELQQKALLPMVIFLKMMRLGSCTGISIVDSTPIFVPYDIVLIEDIFVVVGECAVPVGLRPPSTAHSLGVQFYYLSFMS